MEWDALSRFTQRLPPEEQAKIPYVIIVLIVLAVIGWGIFFLVKFFN